MSQTVFDPDAPIEINHVGGVEGRSLYVNGYRVAGSKPWGGGSRMGDWQTSGQVILAALGVQATAASAAALDLDAPVSFVVAKAELFLAGVNLGAIHTGGYTDVEQAFSTTARELLRGLVHRPQPVDVAPGMDSVAAEKDWHAEYRRVEAPILLARLP